MTLIPFTSDKYGIKINYPSNWEVVDKEWGIFLAFTGPFEDDLLFRPSLVVDIQDMAEDSMSLEEFTVLSLEEMKQMDTGFKLLEQKETTLIDEKAIRIEHIGKQASYSLKGLQIWAIHNNAVYALSYTHGEKYYSKYLDIVSEMINSFQKI